jgi:hypothetical protein
MTNMDHTEALRLQAAEKYALGELTPEVMEEYEEHYFDCFECALDVKAVMAFTDASCQFFREEDARGVPEPVPFFDRVFGWLRPAFAVPVLAGLLLFIGYQNTVIIPNAKRASGNALSVSQPVAAVAPRVPLVALREAGGSSFKLHGSGRGGHREEQGDEKADHLSVHSGQNFEFYFAFLPAPAFDRYVGQLQDADGHAVFEVRMTPEMADREVHVPVPQGLVHAGKYRFLVAGDPAGSGQFQTDKETSRFVFTLEIVP